MGGFLTLHPRASRICAAAFVCLWIAVAVINGQTLADMFSVLRLQAREAAETAKPIAAPR
jgi:hypothetical protein